MTYLLDVNSLLALGLRQHAFHDRVATWVSRLAGAGIPGLATCSIVELGFVRVVSQARQYGFSVRQARELLISLKAGRAVRWIFIADDHDISRLPKWVKSPKETTDGHLVELAKAHGALLATLDEKIKGAFSIP